MSPFQTWRRLFSHVSSHSWSCKAATLEYGYLKSAVAWYGTFTANVLRICDLVSTPRCLYLCCWRCRSRSPAPRWTWWLCWRPAQRRGWVEASAPRAPAFVLEEQNEKPRRLAVGPRPGGSQSFAAAWRKGLPSSWRRYWFPPRSLASDQASPSSLSQNSTTLFLSSCTQVPSELITCHKNGTLYPHSHTAGSRKQPSTYDTSQSVNPH